jgi:tetratricopeptide (TPR) repeat protein
MSNGQTFHAGVASTETILALRRGLAQDPGSRVLRLNLGTLYVQMGRLAMAVPVLQGLLADAAEDKDARFMLAWAEVALGQATAASELISGHGEEGAWAITLGAVAAEWGHWALSTGLFERALQCRPGDEQAWQGLALALDNEHRFQEANHLLDRAVDHFRDDPIWANRFRLHLGENLARMGDFEAGLPLLEVRSRLPEQRALPPMPLPFWQGESLEGRSILVRAEQGFGDYFMLLRYVRVLAERGARVYLEPQPNCGEVLSTTEGLTQCLGSGVNPLPTGTLQVPIASLPLLLGTTQGTIPGRVPYLQVPDQVPNREAVDAALSACPAGRRIGLIWAGNPFHQRDLDRSIPAEVMDLLEDVDGVAWVGLQVGPAARPALPMVDLGPHLRNFATTAYALSKLDALISVDTGPAHLAGALAVPVWLLLPWVPDWRWGLGTAQSPWYPTFELLRQTTPGDWPGVILSLAARLRAR